MGNKLSSNSPSDKGEGKDKKGAYASSSLEVASTIGAASTRAPTTGTYSDTVGSGDDNMTHVGGATEMSGSVSEMMPLNHRRERHRQARQGGGAGGRVGGDPSDDEGGSSDAESRSDESSSGDNDDENDDDDDEDDEPESSGSGGDHLSDSTFKQPKAAGKAAGPTASIHQSTVRGVRFDEQRQTWFAGVKEGGKWKEKSFAVSVYGYDKAKAEAKACRRQNEQDNEKAGHPIKRLSKNEITGVRRDDKNRRWVTAWYENREIKQEYFYEDKLGEEGARQAAIARREMMEKIWPNQRKTVPSLGRGSRKLIDQLRVKKVKGVYFGERNKAWLAQWYERGNPRFKSFPINKHGGIKKAYDKAVACRKAAEASGAASIQQPGERQSGHTGVSWHKQSKAWMASWRDVSGKQQCRYFPVSSWGGDSEAKAAAIRCREKMVEQTKREKQDRQVSSRKRPSGATESRRVRRRVK
ncbi:unnamed protein product [Vitrella brassicaformis CCMP3155]|uniref:AP2/ERF domain-containing protein n=1 Tax=Vitrella brassicaformis (strain CCMP3155) TaxID=1169540 RepID=A0A0G4GLR8_VITBC|nr:unnamed protein product [Vitrella brassicaformis CCMP3155]|eukprot:CEM31025.1 unnamed protein product [Vitrella brassicaformis CCMP3155]